MYIISQKKIKNYVQRGVAKDRNTAAQLQVVKSAAPHIKKQ